MGLSGDTDPTKGLPPVDGSSADVIEVDREEDAAFISAAPFGSVIEKIDAEALISPERHNLHVSGREDAAGKRKAAMFDDRQCKRSRLSDEAEGSVVGERRSRPKKLVSSRDLGLLTRKQIRQSRQVVHTSSSSDEYEVNPGTGDKRQRVGFLFRTAPRPVLPDFLTPDDQWKLEGCTMSKRLKRMERAAGMVCFG